MCGITGVYNFDKKKIIFNDIRKMADTIGHRGPDGEGFWIRNNIGLGHRRLAILDISEKGNQPMVNENGLVVLTYNGEIYNFKKLRTELIKKGHKFKSGSDAETIIHAYEEYGIKCFSMFEGMFALAIWDEKIKRLILARDRLGIKPLYYYVDAKKIVFSSEIKGLLAYFGIKKEIDFEALNYYFFSNQMPISKTIFKNIISVSPAEYIIFSQQGRISKNQYWQLIFKEDSIENEKEAGKHFISLLEDSVKSNLVSDVPIGVALSGGIDSSILTALVSRNSKKPVRTFSFVFEGDTEIKKNDFQMANYIAKLFKTDHNTFILKADDLIENLEKIVESLDMPINTFAFDYYLCQKSSEKVKVLFTGDGSEELLGKYWNHRLAQSMAHILSYLKDKREYNFLEKKFIENYVTITSERSWQFSGLYSFKKNDKNRLYSNFLLKKNNISSIYKYYHDNFKKVTAKNFYNKILEIDTKNFLVSHALTIIDRVSMANSTEIRPPFLSSCLVEYVASLPARMKSRAGITKFILKEGAKEIFPENLINKFESGVTGPPINNWLLLDLKTYVKKILSPKRLRKHGFFKEDYISSLLKEYYGSENIHKSEGNYFFKHPEKNHMAKIWKLLIFQLWWEKYFK
jgi:asparagine synthase (glutamine-hydrolysing)